ncbi:alpha-1,2-fucosyltransferase, partial [Candidatus Parcubacteria bacterium]|nr:alpha-1,2-fucosyltransferase [Candidatus Parcubacteria bacterium]
KEIKKNKISNFLEKLKPIRLRLVITKEQHSHFDSKILKLIGNIYLDGYWQSEKYFKNIENSIRKEFTLKNDLQLKAKKLLRKIKNTESISIHIRRNDYISHKPANQYHGVCHLSYYKKAINVIIKKIDDPHFFVFSDDIDWCKKNLKIKFPTIFVEGNKDYEDLILMSKCKHNIIANSTFSWWGAWLNNNPNKIVIAPKKWFRKKSINTKDLIPKTWIKI